MAEKHPPGNAPKDRRYLENALGVILFDEDLGSLAACWSDKCPCDPWKVSTNFAECVWLANKPAAFLRENASFPDQATIHPDGWLGPTWNTIANEWGCSGSEAFRHARSLSRVATASAMIIDEAMEQAFGADWIASASPGKSMLQLQGIRSGLAKAFDPLLQITRPKERVLAEAAKTLQHCEVKSQNGIRRNGANSTAFCVHYPRIRYAEALAAERTPAEGNWIRIKMPDPRQTLSGKTLEFLSQRNRPIIVVGCLYPNSPDAPFWVRSWATGGGRETRSAFTLEECKILLNHGEIGIRDAYEGPGWLERPEDTILGKCVDALKAACGCELTARHSWSAGLAAETFLKSIVCRPAAKSSIPALEAAWLAAADRMKMVRAIEVLQSAGCVVRSASAGTIKARTRAHPDQLSRVASAVRNEGLILPMSHAQEFERLGANLPDVMQAFNGSKTDRFQADIAIKHSRKTMWHLNEALTYSREYREEATMSALRHPAPINKTHLTLRSALRRPAAGRPKAPPNTTTHKSAVESPDSSGRIGNRSSESLSSGLRGRSSRRGCSETEA